MSQLLKHWMKKKVKFFTFEQQKQANTSYVQLTLKQLGAFFLPAAER